MKVKPKTPTLWSLFVQWLVKKTFGNKVKLIEHLELTDLNSEFNDKYLFDFLNYSSQYNQNRHRMNEFDVPDNDNDNDNVIEGMDSSGVPLTQPGGILMAVGANGSKSKNVPEKIAVKPIDVLNELETVPTPFTLTLLDEKIGILKDKEKLIVQRYANREIKALIERVENRKKYATNSKFFDQFSNTTDEKIALLLSKYQLVMKTSDIFVPEFPDEAIKVMKDYTEKCELLFKKKPLYYVIAEEKDFKKAWDKRDPILLVQSPFGFYWQILGAWDKEMLILSEL